MAVSGSFDETVRLWNIKKGTCHRTIAAHSEAVTGVDFNRDGSILATSSYDGLIRLWDSSNGQCLKTLDHGDSSPIGNIVFSPNSFQLLATSLDNSIRLWDIANSRIMKTYLGHQNEKFAIKACFSAFKSPSSKSTSSKLTSLEPQPPPVMIVAGSEDQRIYIWDLQTKKVLHTLVGHKDAVLAVATHSTQSLIASASLDHDPCIKVSFPPPPPSLPHIESFVACSLSSTLPHSTDLEADNLPRLILYNTTTQIHPQEEERRSRTSTSSSSSSSSRRGKAPNSAVTIIATADNLVISQLNASHCSSMTNKGLLACSCISIPSLDTSVMTSAGNSQLV